MVMFCTAVFFIFMFNNAFAFDGTSLSVGMCKIAGVAQDNIAKGIATISVIMLGIGAMLGKISWSMALLLVVGIAIVFNAGAIASLVQSNANCGID
jgi:type IV secretory pathway VirB2 component (pilin)